MAAAERGEKGETEGEFRPAEAHLDRLGLSKGGREVSPPPSFSPPFSRGRLPILPHGTLFLRPPPPPLPAPRSLESAQREWCARIYMYM